VRTSCAWVLVVKGGALDFSVPACTMALPLPACYEPLAAESSLYTYNFRVWLVFPGQRSPLLDLRRSCAAVRKPGTGALGPPHGAAVSPEETQQHEEITHGKERSRGSNGEHVEARRAAAACAPRLFFSGAAGAHRADFGAAQAPVARYPTPSPRLTTPLPHLVRSSALCVRELQEIRS